MIENDVIGVHEMYVGTVRLYWKRNRELSLKPAYTISPSYLLEGAYEIVYSSEDGRDKWLAYFELLNDVSYYVTREKPVIFVRTALDERGRKIEADHLLKRFIAPIEEVLDIDEVRDFLSEVPIK